MYRIPIDDNLQNSEIYEMSKFLTIILPIINSHLNHQKDNILIHCYAGIQRSAIVVLSYLYKYVDSDINKCINYMKQKRPIVFTPKMNFKKSIYYSFNKNI